MRLLAGLAVLSVALFEPMALADDFSVERCSGYAAAYDVAPSQDNIGKLMSAASCHEKGHRLADALKAWKRVAVESKNADTKATAETNATRLDASVATLVIESRPGYPPLGARVDGVEVQIGAPVPVNAGSHRVESSDGHSIETTTTDGQHATISIPFDVATPPPNGGKGTEPPSPSRALLVGGIIATSTGGLGAIAFAITGGISLSNDAKLDELCGEDRKSCGANLAEAQDVASVGRTSNVVNVVALVVGIAGLGAGVPMMIVGARSGASTGAAVGLPLPWARRDAAGISVRGAF